ncbi:hypothetical protein [Sphingomonas beigongshangi]|uniref:hypothetical protein n=1 Tax=Sphingomonas beigongshangi TaxID=2782540 RepID=UPI00193B5646|nr:hypothetical protein [Sphingomonas beigongshangi]
MQQAEGAHSATVTAASPRKSNDLSASRRGALGMLATLPMLVAASPSTPRQGASDSDWNAATENLLKAERILAAATAQDVAARAAYAAGEPDRATVDWEGLNGILPRIGTYRAIDIGAAREATQRQINRGYWLHDPGRALRRLAALDQLEAFREAAEINDQKHARRAKEAADRCDEAIADVCRCEDRLLEMPSPNRKALLWKLERLINDDGDGCTASWSIAYVEPMLRDARRLLGSKHNLPI